MFKGSWLQKALQYSLCLIAFAIPFPYIVCSLTVALFACLWLLQVNGKELVGNLKSRKIIWVWIGFFLLHAISYTYSIDKHESTFDLQRKLSFVVFPLLLGAGKPIEKKTIERVFFSLILGVTVAGMYFITRALVIYYCTGETTQFFYHYLIKGSDANAVYHSLYALFAITILLFFNWDIKFMKYSRIVFIIFLVIFFILLSSRTLIIIFFIAILPSYFRYSFKNSQRSYLYTVILLMFYLTLALVLFNTDNPVKQRYTEIINHSEQLSWNNYKNKESEFNNLSLRLFLWRVGFDNIREHHLWIKGAGNGSIYTLQNRKMSEYGVPDIYNEQYRSPLYDVNLHNMYIQVLMMLGIIGVVIFLALIFSPLFYLKYSEFRNIILIFNFTILILMMQESSLQTQAGIVYYSFFSMLFYNNSFVNRTKEITV